MAFMVPDAVATHFHVRHGDRVADFGAGSGHFTKVLSRLVGGEGKVFAVEIQKPLAQSIAERARTERLSNVESIWGDIEIMGGTKIAQGSLDAVVISNTLSMISKKDVALQEAARVLRKGGKLLIIEWSDSAGGMGPKSDMVITETAVRSLCEQQGFVFEQTFPAGDHHYGHSFRRA